MQRLEEGFANYAWAALVSPRRCGLWGQGWYSFIWKRITPLVQARQMARVPSERRTVFSGQKLGLFLTCLWAFFFFLTRSLGVKAGKLINKINGNSALFVYDQLLSICWTWCYRHCYKHWENTVTPFQNLADCWGDWEMSQHMLHATLSPAIEHQSSHLTLPATSWSGQDMHCSSSPFSR